MKIPSDVKYIRKVSSEIETILRSNDADDSSIFDIRLSVEEAVKNAIIHGNKNNKDVPVHVSYSLEGSKFSVEVEDQGAGFDPRSVPDPTRNENIMKTSGRGIFLIHKLMDEVKYNAGGKKVFMAKFIKKKRRGDNAS